MTRSWRLTTLAGATLLAAAGCGSRADTGVDANKAAVRIVPVTVAPLQRRQVERTVDATGTLKGWEEVVVGTKRAGRVLKVHFDMGDRVEPGAALVELDPVDSVLTVKQAEKQLDAELAKLGLMVLPGASFDVGAVPAVVQARVTLDQARRDLARVRSLYQRGSTTIQELQDTEDKERSAGASLDAASVAARSTLANALALEIALNVAEQARGDMVIHAPTPSTPPKDLEVPVRYAVSQRMISEGQMLQVGEGMYKLVVENPLRLWVQVPERSSGQVKLDQAARVTVDSFPERVFEGKVTRINPAVDEASRTFQVEIALRNDETLLHPGGFAEASIIVDAEDDAQTVPLEALVEFAGVTKVFVVDGGQSRSITVTKGIEGPGWIEVLGEFPADPQLIVTGQSLLADGTKIVVRDPDVGPSVASSPATSPNPGSAQ